MISRTTDWAAWNRLVDSFVYNARKKTLSNAEIELRDRMGAEGLSARSVAAKILTRPLKEEEIVNDPQWLIIQKNWDSDDRMDSRVAKFALFCLAISIPLHLVYWWL